MSITATRTDTVDIFPPSSTCLLIGASLSGKSTLVKYLITEHCYFFTQPIRQFLIVYCNLQSRFIFDRESIENINIVQIYLSEFDTSILIEGTFLIFEDASDSHPFIKSSISTYTHHGQLTATFVLCQNISGSLSDLVGLVHKVIFFTKAKTVAKDFKHIVQRFVSDVQLKTYLNSVFQFVSSTASSLLLELYSRTYIRFSPVAFSHLELLKSGGCKIYLGPSDMSTEEFGKDIATLHPFDATDNADEGRNEFIPKNTLIVLPLEFVASFKHSSLNESPCEKNEAWIDVVNDIEDDIDSFIHIKRRKCAKLLLSRILHSDQFCITSPDKFLYLKRKPTYKVAILEFVSFVTRTKGPNEILQPHQIIFIDIKKVLLQKGAPSFLFKNVLLDSKQINRAHM